MPKDYRNRYALEDIAREEKEKRNPLTQRMLDLSKGLGGYELRGISPEESSRREYERVKKEDEKGLIDPLVNDVAPLTPPGMLVRGLAEAGEEIRKDPRDFRSYAKAAQKFGEGGLADPSSMASEAMARYWVSPKGEKINLRMDDSHWDTAKREMKMTQPDAIKAGAVRVSDNVVHANDPRLINEVDLRSAAKDALREGSPVFVRIGPMDYNSKEYTIWPKDLINNDYDITPWIGKSKKAGQ